MSAVVLLTLLSTEPDPADDPDDRAEAIEETGDVADDLDGAARATLADADREAGGIALHAGRVRSAQSRAVYWPKLAISLGLGGAHGPRRDRAAGTPDRWRFAGTGGLVWSVVATWGQP